MDKSGAKPVCDTCPSRFFARSDFKIRDDNSITKNFDPTKRYRVDESGTPTCIHPERVGLPADNNETLHSGDVMVSPAPLEASALGSWVLESLSNAPESEFDAILDRLHELSTAANIPEELFVSACRDAIAQLSQQ